MTEWYYSDAQRQQQGPVGSDELAALHHQGVLTPDSLVWHEGLSEWKPWREMMAEVVAGDDATSAAAGVAEAVAEPAPSAPETTFDPGVERTDDTYAIDDGFESSPYSPPKAVVADNGGAPVAGGRVVYAGFLKRFAALFIDNLIAMVASYAIIIPMYMLLGFGAFGANANTENPLESGMLIAMMLGTYAVYFIVPSVYYGWMQSSSTQATLGKMAVGIKVVRGDGARIGFWRGFLRHLAQLLFAIVTCGLGSLISAIMTAVTERKQALHDMICDTVVVDKYAFTANQDWQKEELSTATIVILVIEALFVLGIIALYAVILGMAMNGKGLF